MMDTNDPLAVCAECGNPTEESSMEDLGIADNEPYVCIECADEARSIRPELEEDGYDYSRTHSEGWFYEDTIS